MIIVHTFGAMKIKALRHPGYLRLLLFLIYALLATQSCKVVNKSYAIESDARLSLTIPPTSDTSAVITLATGSCTYNVDSFMLVRSDNSFGLKSLKNAKVAYAEISLANADTSNNFGNFENCRMYFHTDVDTQQTYGYIRFIPDTFSSSLQLYSASSSLDLYLRNASNEFPAFITFNYSIRAKLRRPIKDSIHCAIHIPNNLFAGKTN